MGNADAVQLRGVLQQMDVKNGSATLKFVVDPDLYGPGLTELFEATGQEVLLVVSSTQTRIEFED